MAHVLEHVEKLRERSSKKYAGLAHDFGAGAACKNCKDSCPGFQLHYWRKICLNCRCSKEEHNIDETLLRDKIRWDQVGDLVSNKNGGTFTAPRKFILDGTSFGNEIGQQRSRDRRQAGSVDSKLELDWAPPNASPDLVHMYFNSVPKDQWPVAGSQAAEKRKKNLEQQLPLQDIAVECLVDAKPEERSGLQHYIDQLGSGIIGQAQIIRYQHPKVDFVPGKDPSMASPMHYDDDYLSGTMGKMTLNDQHQPPDRHYQLRVSSTQVKSQPQAMAQPLSAFSQDVPSPRRMPPIVPPKPLRAKVVQPLPRADLQYAGEQKVLPGSQHYSLPAGDGRGKASGHCGNYPDLLGSLGQSSHVGEYGQMAQGATSLQQGSIGHISNVPQHAQWMQQPGKGHGMPDLHLQELDDNQQQTHQLPMKNPVGQKDSHRNKLFQPTDQQFVSGQPKFAENLSQASGLPGYPQSAVKGKLTSGYVDPMGHSQHKAVGGATAAIPCIQCKKPVHAGDVAVAIPNVNPDLVWHPACFVCCVCGERLEDLIYCHSGGRVYCARHYGDNAKKIPRCKGCDQLIFADQFTNAEGYYWHLEHFACWHCDANLGGKHYTWIDGVPFCMPCYVAKETVKCESCLAMVPPGVSRIGIKGAFWHHTPKCFSCKRCSQSLIGMQVLCKDSKVFCSVKCRDSLAPALVSTV